MNLHILLNVSTGICNYVKFLCVSVIDCAGNCLCMRRDGMFSVARKGEVPILNAAPLAAV